MVAVRPSPEDVKPQVELRGRRLAERQITGGRVSERTAGHGGAALRGLGRNVPWGFGLLPPRPTVFMPLLLRGIACAALLCGVWTTQAQTPREVTQPYYPASNGTPARISAARPTSLVLEGAVDPDAYIVGPGDGFTVSIGGSVSRQFNVSVAADGRLVIPESGTVQAADRTLARVRSDALVGLQRRYANVPTDVVLSSPREFYVHVSGLVPEPGRRLVPAVARVEDALTNASGLPISALAQYARTDEEDGDPTSLRRRPALRSVRVTSRSGRTTIVDLMRYIATGDVASNPYLLDGDAVVLPSFDPVVEGVVVGGAVDRPGTYDVRPGDSVLDLIVVTSGTEAAARIARVRRVRRGAPTVEVPLSEAGSVEVLGRDEVFAVPAFEDAAQAFVEGAVRFPGVYPILRGETTLAMLVEMAGGLREDALARGAYLERPYARRTPELAEATDGTVREPVLPDVSVDADVLGSLFGRRYLSQQESSVPRLSVDIEDVLAGGSSVELYPRDRLVIPFDIGLVRVTGRVARAGYLPFVEGQTAADYVAQAGGSLPTASSVYVVDAATGQLAEGEDTVVRAGDGVFVNTLYAPDSPQYAALVLQERQSQREESRDRRQARYQLVQTFVSVVGTLATLIVAYSAIQRSSGN